MPIRRRSGRDAESSAALISSDQRLLRTARGAGADRTQPDRRRVTYTLDRSGVPVGVPGMVSHVSYDPDGAVSEYVLPNGITISSPRDPVSRRLVEVAARKDGATLRQLGYGYHAIGNIVAIHDEMPGDTQFRRSDFLSDQGAHDDEHERHRPWRGTAA
jgi:hypothetical protein